MDNARDNPLRDDHKKYWQLASNAIEEETKTFVLIATKSMGPKSILFYYYFYYYFVN